MDRRISREEFGNETSWYHGGTIVASVYPTTGERWSCLCWSLDCSKTRPVKNLVVSTKIEALRAAGAHVAALT